MIEIQPGYAQIDLQAVDVPPETMGCPSHPLVQERWLAACEKLSQQQDWAGIELIGLNFPNPERLPFYASICFCPACHYGYGAMGGILEQVAREKVAAGDLHAATPPQRDHPSVETLLLWRRSVQFGLLQQIREVVRQPLCVLTAAQLRYTGRRSSLTFFEMQSLAAAASIVWEPGVEAVLGLPRPLPLWVRCGAEEEVGANGIAGVIREAGLTSAFV
jgi:hypothetical protein